jgi:hypothetical protein
MMCNFPKLFVRARRAFEFSYGLGEAVFLFCYKIEKARRYGIGVSPIMLQRS